MPVTIMDLYETMDYGPAPEDAGEALRWLNTHNGQLSTFIAGAYVAMEPGGSTFATRNPATGDVLAMVSQAGPAVVDAAVLAARAALPAWQALSGHARARCLYALARQIQKHARVLAVLESLDTGKPIRESRDLDIPLAARHFLYHAGWAQLLGDLGDDGFAGENFRGSVPVGVIAAIIPWNFPLLMLAWKVAPALAAGCTVVLKPAEYTPLTASLFAELAQAAGLPAGVLNILQGDGRTGELLVKHPAIDKVAFTGSTEVGRLIRRVTAGTGKKLSLELGGKSPFVVFDDADLDSAVEGLVDGIWLNGGQVCCAGSRLLVQESVSERLYAKIRARMLTLRVGSPLDKSIDVGAIADQVQFDRIQSYIAQGVEEGATCWQPEMELPAKGLFLKPTLLTGVSPAATVAQEEIFGPVLAAMTFRTPAEAVELANNTRYGLAASLWTEDINVALDVAAQIKAGVVWINSTNVFDAACPFGGYRESGFGREGGPEGLWEYLQPAWLCGSRQGGAATPLPEPAPGSEFAQAAPTLTPVSESALQTPAAPLFLDIDRTVKQYIGGRQVRPDSGQSTPVHSLSGELVGYTPVGNRKDVRNAVEAARSATLKWARQTAHHRAQILFYLAENLSQRREEIIRKLAAFTGPAQAALEFDLGLNRIFTYAAWCDKFEGSVHNPPSRMIALTLPDAVGTIAIVAGDEAPWLGLLSLVLPAVAMGNAVVAVPSEPGATLIGDLYQALDTSDVPAGVINLIAGRPGELGRTLAEHDDLDALWIFRDASLAGSLEAASAGNLKQVWSLGGRPIDWFDPAQGEGRMFLRHATQAKTIWVPYGA